MLDIKILIIFELYMIKIDEKLLKQLRNGSPLWYLEVLDMPKTITSTRCRAKGLFSSAYSRSCEAGIT